MRLGVAKRGGILDCVRYDNSAVYRPRGLGGSKAERRLTISGGLTGAKRASDFIVGAIGKESLQECQVSSKESTHRGREHAIDTKILRLWHIDLDGDGSLEAYQWKARHQPVSDFQRVPHAGSTGKFLIKSCPELEQIPSSKPAPVRLLEPIRAQDAFSSLNPGAWLGAEPVCIFEPTAASKAQTSTSQSR